MKPIKNILWVGPTGGVGSVAVQIFSERNPDVKITGISRDLSKYDRLNKMLKRPIKGYKVDAYDIDQVCQLLKETGAGLLVHTGLPYHNLALMMACLQTKVNYLDTACYEPEDEARYRHLEQWNYNKAFREAGITGVVGCGFDPGVTGAWVADALKRIFREISSFDIVDCNGGEHGYEVRTNFNFALNYREFSNRSYYYRKGRRIYVPSIDEPGAIHQMVNVEKIGEQDIYLIAHEELESLEKNFPQIVRKRFWMSFGKKYIKTYKAFGELGLRSIQKYLLPKEPISPYFFLSRIVPKQSLIEKHYELLEKIGMLSGKPLKLDVREISPIEFAQRILPDPAGSAKGYTNISIIMEGIGKDGKRLRYRRGQICSHEECQEKWGANAVSGTTGGPAAAGAEMFRKGMWQRELGVFNVEQLAPGPFLKVVQENLPMWEEFGDEVLRLKK